MSQTDDVIARMCEFYGVESDSDLARKLKKSPSTVSSWRQRQTIPYEDCFKLAKLGVSMRWLIEGLPEKNDYAFAESPSPSDGSMIRVPLHDVRAAAGSGAITDDYPELIRHFDFPEWWLRSVLRVTPGAIEVLLAWGDSMKPDVLAGDLLIVDKTHTSVKADALYVFEMDGGVFIKKLQRLPGGRLKVISANPDYEAYNVTPSSDPTFKVVGRVAFHGKVT